MDRHNDDDDDGRGRFREQRNGENEEEELMYFRRDGGGEMQRRGHSLNLHRATLLDAIDNVFIEDPLSEYFRNDRVLVETTSEAETLFESLPLVKQLVQGSSPAVKLLLRENTIVYKQARTKVPPTQPGAAFTPICQAYGGLEIPEMEILIPLSLPVELGNGSTSRNRVEVELLRESYDFCGKGWYPVETLVVRVDGETICAVDAPTNAEEFVAAFRRQSEKAARDTARVYGPIPIPVVDVHEATIRLWLDSIPTPGQLFMLANISANSSSDTRAQERMIQMEIARQMKMEFQRKYRDYCRTVREIMAGGRGRYINGQFIPLASVVVAAAAPVLTAEMVREEDNHDNLIHMSVDDVAAALRDLGISKQYMDCLRAHQVDGAMLSMMDDDTLKELKVESAFERKKILVYVLKSKRKNKVEVASQVVDKT